jgi:hypothetical protein
MYPQHCWALTALQNVKIRFFNKIRCTFWLNGAFVSISFLLQEVMFAQDCKSSNSTQNIIYEAKKAVPGGHSSSADNNQSFTELSCFTTLLLLYIIINNITHHLMLKLSKQSWFPMYEVMLNPFQPTNSILWELYENDILAFHEVVWLWLVGKSSFTEVLETNIKRVDVPTLSNIALLSSRIGACCLDWVFELFWRSVYVIWTHRPCCRYNK